MGNNAVYVLLAFVPSFVIYLGFPGGGKTFFIFRLVGNSRSFVFTGICTDCSEAQT